MASVDGERLAANTEPAKIGAIVLKEGGEGERGEVNNRTVVVGSLIKAFHTEKVIRFYHSMASRYLSNIRVLK